MIDRRAAFFFVAALASGVLYPLAPSDLRWVPVGVCTTYLVLAVLSALDAWSAGHDRTDSGRGASRGA